MRILLGISIWSNKLYRRLSKLIVDANKLTLWSILVNQHDYTFSSNRNALAEPHFHSQSIAKRNLTIFLPSPTATAKLHL